MDATPTNYKPIDYSLANKLVRLAPPLHSLTTYNDVPVYDTIFYKTNIKEDIFNEPPIIKRRLHGFSKLFT
jgi:hypothetical protein